MMGNANSGPWQTAFQEKRSGVAMDYTYEKVEQNIMTNVGFSNTCYQVLNLRRGAGLWLAPVCSTWIYLWLGYNQEGFWFLCPQQVTSMVHQTIVSNMF